MSPLLQHGQLVLVRAGAYRATIPKRGEVVAARPASLGGRAVVKRIVGLPYESIVCGEQRWSLGADEFLLLGDHPQDSLDSRRLGPISLQELIGPLWLRLWPPTILA